MNPNIATCQEIDMSVGNSTGNVTKISEKYFLHKKLLSYYVDFYSSELHIYNDISWQQKKKKRG